MLTNLVFFCYLREMSATCQRQVLEEDPLLVEWLQLYLAVLAF